ncbi:MAG: hypothetical protein RLZZ423_1547, partial [Cyanobacteriota bacterium]
MTISPPERGKAKAQVDRVNNPAT